MQTTSGTRFCFHFQLETVFLRCVFYCELPLQPPFDCTFDRPAPSGGPRSRLIPLSKPVELRRNPTGQRASLIRCNGAWTRRCLLCRFCCFYFAPKFHRNVFAVTLCLCLLGAFFSNKICFQTIDLETNKYTHTCTAIHGVKTRKSETKLRNYKAVQRLCCAKEDFDFEAFSQPVKLL